MMILVRFEVSCFTWFTNQLYAFLPKECVKIGHCVPFCSLVFCAVIDGFGGI